MAGGPDDVSGDDAGLITVGPRASLIEIFCTARDAGDVALMTSTALALPSSLRFGAHPGQVPALIHEAYAMTTEPAARGRLAAALARAWAYGGDTEQARRFAVEAIALADREGDAAALADALDAALLASWGPDQFAGRLKLAARLADTASHLVDPELRLTAHLWRLTTAWECLDVVAIQRQLRALDVLAEESGSVRAAFFASSRRATLALATGDLDAIDGLINRTEELGAQAVEPDLQAVVHSLVAERARLVGDVEVLRREAAAFEGYGADEGIRSVTADAAVLWLAAGDSGRALELLHQLVGTSLDSIDRDVDFLLIIASVVEVAVALDQHDIAGRGARLLEPYVGRAVLNAGAVTFHGAVEDYVYRAHRSIGSSDAERWRHSAESLYRRIGAVPWLRRLDDHLAIGPGDRQTADVMHLHPDGALGWMVGREGATRTLPDLKGLHHLRHLLRHPGAEISAGVLAAAGEGRANAMTERADEVIDTQALAAYRQRLRDVDDDLAEAESWSDEARIERLRDERAALLDQVSRATGLGGRRRQFTSADERARVAVRKAIASTLQRIEQQDQPVARLLRDTIHTGSTCRYEPDPARPVVWRLDRPTGVIRPSGRTRHVSGD